MYLWCANCCHAHLRSAWEVVGYKYGVCPSCGHSEYKNAIAWLNIAAANDYPDEPDPRKTYFLQPVLFE